MTFELIFLGTGTSAGVPMIACDCEVCTSADPRDHRTRPSVLVRYSEGGSDTGDTTPAEYLIDTTPELRQQVIGQKLMHLDGVFYTHNHADHVFGIDDLRRFNAVSGRALDIYGEPRVLQWLTTTFRYIFDSPSNVNQSFVPTLVLNPVLPADEPDAPPPLLLRGAMWTPLRLLHGRLPILGFRVDFAGFSLAYCTDVSKIPPQTLPLLRGLDVLVIDALRYRHHPTHLTVDEALWQVEQARPRRAYLTHLAHDVLHADLEPKLPANVRIAYDGLRVDVAGVRAAPSATAG